jgi:catechol 2,3-dioxygenase-like lactoylglutathione lyase family enzyme
MASFRVQGIDHVELNVPDRDQAAAWYERHLGLEPRGRWDEPGPVMVACPDGSMLAFFRGDPRGDRSTVGFHRVAFRVDAEGFVAFRARVQDDPVCDAAGGSRAHLEVVDYESALSVYLHDPWGYPLEVTTYDVTAARNLLEAR